MATGYTLTENAARRTAAAVRQVLGTATDARGRRGPFREPAADPLAYGKLVNAWSPGNATVTLTPCDAAGNVVTPAPANVEVSIFDGGRPPAMFDAAVGNVLAYFATAGGVGSSAGGSSNSSSGGVLLSPPVLTIPERQPVLRPAAGQRQRSGQAGTTSALPREPPPMPPPNNRFNQVDYLRSIAYVRSASLQYVPLGQSGDAQVQPPNLGDRVSPLVSDVARRS